VAWDQTTGIHGTMADVSASGGSAAFSVTSDIATLTVTAVNDAPTAAAPATHYAATEQTPLVISGTGLHVADIDGNGGTETVTLSVGEGILDVDLGGNAVSVTGNGTSSVTITGLIDYIEALLSGDNSGTISYTANSDNPGASTDLTLSVNDDGNSGSGGSQTATATTTIDITPVDDAPSNQAPVLSAESIRVVENDDLAVTTTVFDIKLSDDDQTSNLTITATAEWGTVSPVETGNVLAINTEFAGGIIYTPTDYNGDTELNDIVTLTATDTHGQSDILNFVFQQSGSGGATLIGTDEKDVIFATEGNDTLTGNAKADQFVFAPEYQYGPSTDEITDFKVGEDHIDLRGFAQFVDAENITEWLADPDHVTTSGGDKLITLDTGDTITLKGLAAASLHASDFIVSPHH
jgi:hypothetical protein